MDVPSYLLGKNAGGGGGGTTYTAGTNIEITSENVINNKIPYLNDSNGVSIAPGGSIGGYYGTVTGFGKEVNLANDGATAFGYQALANTNSTSIGRSAGNATAKNAISIGAGATAEQYEARFGSNFSNTNKITIYTANGVKEMATQDYVDAAIANAITNTLGGSY